MIRCLNPRVRTAHFVLCACLVLGAGAAAAQSFPQPIGPDPASGYRPVGEPIRVEVTDLENPLYLKIHFTAGDLRNVDHVAITDRTARRELYRFTRSQFGPQIQGVPDSTPVTFGKNLTFRRPEQRPHHQIMIEANNERGRPLRVTAFDFRIQPHPAETLSGEVSHQTFFDIAQIEFRDACRMRARMGEAAPGIFIGEVEQEFPSLAYLTNVQTRESLRGYFEGCVQAYSQCLGQPPATQQVHSFCTEQRQKLRREVFSGG